MIIPIFSKVQSSEYGSPHSADQRVGPQPDSPLIGGGEHPRGKVHKSRQNVAGQ